jgi:hypothetical protein
MWTRLGALAACLVALAADPAPVELFNGKDLSGWVAEGVVEYKDADGQPRPVWSVRDGLLCCDGKGFGFLRYDRRQFADFVFHVEFRMAPRCNSGIGIRTGVFDPKKSRATRPSFAAYEIQLSDDAGKPPSKHSTGSLYRYVAPRVNPIRPAGEWNALDIECVGPRIRIAMNGQELTDVDQTAVAEIKAKPLKGYVCLQNHGGTIAFRNLRIEEKKAAAGESSPGKKDSR